MNRAERLHLRAELSEIRQEGSYVAASARRTGNDMSCVVGNPQIGILAALGIPLNPGGANAGKKRNLAPAIKSVRAKLQRRPA
jgi:hypothetical protein